MTTIAWTGSEVAGDTRGTIVELIQQSPTEKLIKRKGVIYCLTGDLAQCLAVVDWLSSGADIDEAPTFLEEPEFDILAIHDSVTGYVYASEYYAYRVDPPFTLGTGHALALGAILAGAGAKRAVEVSAMADINTGLPVQLMKVKNG